jgi:hypothetical protein
MAEAFTLYVGRVKTAMPKMKPARSVLLLTYGTLALAAGIGIGEAAISLEILGPRSDADRTVLEQRVESARAIEAALHKPLPAIAALPPITATLANPGKVVARDQSGRGAWSGLNSLPPGARDAMAKAGAETAGFDGASSSAANDTASSGVSSSNESSTSRYSVKYDRATRSGF